MAFFDVSGDFQNKAAQRRQAMNQALGNVLGGITQVEQTTRQKALDKQKLDLQKTKLIGDLITQGADPTQAQTLIESRFPSEAPEESRFSLLKKAPEESGFSLLKKAPEQVEVQPQQDFSSLFPQGTRAQQKFSNEKELTELRRDEARYKKRQRDLPFKQRDKFKITQAMGGVQSNLQAERDEAKFQREQQRLADPRVRLQKLPTTAKGDLGSIASGIQALGGMQEAINAGIEPEFIDANTPLIGRFISDTPFTRNQRVLSEVIGRLQSGGAITDDEIDTFRALGPRPGSTATEQLAALEQQKAFLANKLAGLGFSAEELPGLGFETAPIQIQKELKRKEQAPKVNSNEAKEAIKWLQKHPNDPKAEAVIKRLNQLGVR
jgi:hypothetical protein